MYYVYAYLREDGSPYYIGKGSGKRIHSPIRAIPKPKELDRRVVVADGLTEPTALELEHWLIVGLGRKDLGTGILRNMSDGGDNNPSRVVSLETRQKMSQARLGKKHSEETRRKISASSIGKKISEETREKYRVASTDRPKSKEFIEQMERIRSRKKAIPK